MSIGGRESKDAKGRRMSDPESEELQQLRIEIGNRVKELREKRDYVQQDVADRLKGNKKANNKPAISRIENGKQNASLDVLLNIIVNGLETDLAEFWRPWVTDDKQRDAEEATARSLLERLLNGDKGTRHEVINALRELRAVYTRSRKSEK